MLCLVNFAAQVLLTHRGLTDYFYLVTISHFIILIGFVAAAWLVVRAIREHTIRPELLRSLIGGLLACIVGVGIDLLRFHFFKSYGSSHFTRIGVLILSILIGVYLLGERTRALKQKQQETMTLVDGISKAFARVIDMKDRYTNGHSSRVAKYTAKLAKELGYDEETVRKYYCIKEVSGKQLMPDVVDAFLRLVKKGEFRAADDHGGGSMESIENIRNQ